MAPYSIMGWWLVVQIVWHLQWRGPMALQKMPCNNREEPSQAGPHQKWKLRGTQRWQNQRREPATDQAGDEAVTGGVNHRRTWTRSRSPTLAETSSQHGQGPVLREPTFAREACGHTAGHRGKADQAQADCRGEEETPKVPTTSRSRRRQRKPTLSSSKMKLAGGPIDVDAEEEAPIPKPVPVQNGELRALVLQLGHSVQTMQKQLQNVTITQVRKWPPWHPRWNHLTL